MFAPAGDESDDDLMFCSDYKADDQVENDEKPSSEVFATPATSNTTIIGNIYIKYIPKC